MTYFAYTINVEYSSRCEKLEDKKIIWVGPM